MTLLESVPLLVFAFTAGVFTFFAPCAYPLLPGYVSYYLGRTTSETAESTPSRERTVTEGRLTGYVADGFGVVVSESRAVHLARAVVVGVLVSSGFFLVYGVLAGVVVAFGTRILGGIGVSELVVGTVLIVLGGLMALGWTPPTSTVVLPERRRSTAGYVGFGVLYAAAAAGCTSPIFIGIALEALSVGTGVGLVTFGAYALGMSVLMIGVTVATALGRDALLSRFAHGAGRIRRIAGILLLVAGVIQMYFFLFRFQGIELLGI